MPKITFGLSAYLVAREVQRAANSVCGGSVHVLAVDKGRVVWGHTVVRWAALADDLPIPTGVVVNIDHTLARMPLANLLCFHHEESHLHSKIQAALHQLVVFPEVGRVKVPTNDIVGEILPTDRQTEDVHAIILFEVLHLGCTSAGHSNAIL